MSPGDRVRLRYTLIFPAGGRLAAGSTVTLNAVMETSGGRRWVVIQQDQWFSGLRDDDFDCEPDQH